MEYDAETQELIEGNTPVCIYLIIYPAVILSTLPFHFQPANKARTALDEADRRLRDQ
jgi:hypothetical protein